MINHLQEARQAKGYDSPSYLKRLKIDKVHRHTPHTTHHTDTHTHARVHAHDDVVCEVTIEKLWCVCDHVDMF